VTGSTIAHLAVKRAATGFLISFFGGLDWRLSTFPVVTFHKFSAIILI